MKSLIAAALLLQLSPALATAQPDARQPAIQGSRLPGIPVAGTETAGDKRHGPVEVAFTKWRTAVIPATTGVPTRYLFKGFIGGDLGDGGFVGELLDRRASTPCTAFDPPCTPGVTPATISGSIIALDAIYEVQAGEHSFTALIKGGTNAVTGAALLDGVILAGWRTGTRVHVAFQTMTNCADAPAGTCFQGVIRVERAGEE
jgi:hypothetical protein